MVLTIDGIALCPVIFGELPVSASTLMPSSKVQYQATT